MGLLGGLFGGGGGTTKAGKKAAADLYARAQAVADKPYVAYDGPRVADITPTLQSGITNAMNAGKAGAGAVNAAINLAKSAGGYTPQTVTGATVAPTANVTGANIDRSMLGTIGNNSITNMNVDEYMNPYLRNVLDTTLADLNRQREIQRQTDNSRAVAAGAFGGSRQAVVDAETNRALLDTSARTAADIYSKGYDSATGLMTNDANRLQAGQIANQATDLTAANANAGFAQQAALANQGVQYNTSLQNAELAQAAALANQTAGLTANQQGLQSSSILGDIGNNQAQASIAAGELGLKAGTIGQINEQAKLDAQYEAYLREQGYPAQMIAMLTGAVAPVAGQQTNTSGGIVPGLASMFAPSGG